MPKDNLARRQRGDGGGHNEDLRSVSEVANDNGAFVETLSSEKIGLVEDIRLRERVLAKLAVAVDLFGRARLNQIEAIEALNQKLQDPSWNLTGYFVQPTGAGKTVLFGLLVKALQMQTMILVPKTNLLMQTKDELVKMLGIAEEDIGIVGEGYSEHDRPITISTYQSHLANYSGKQKWYRDKLAKLEVLICDEAHKALGDATQKSLKLEEEVETEVLSKADKQFGKTVLKLAFTATPKLAAKSVQIVFGKTEIARETYANLVRSGVLVPFRMFHTEGRILVGEDYEEGHEMTLDEEAKVLARERTYQKLLDMYAELHTSTQEKLRTAVFCSSISECDKFMELAQNEYGLKCIRVTSKDDKEALKRAEQGLMDGTYDMVVTVDKLTEGWNFPPLNTVINARATNSPARLLQGCGRAGRTFNGKRWANIFETNWTVGRMVNKSLNNAERLPEQGGDRVRRTSPEVANDVNDDGSVEKEFVGKRALNLMEGFLANGENIQDLSVLCLNTDGEPLQYETLGEKERVRVIARLREEFTPEQWAGMNRNKKQAYKFQPGNLGLVALAGILGVGGDPVANQSFHLAMGQEIWGDLECLKIEERIEVSKEQVIARLREEFTPEQWAGMNYNKKKAYKFQPGNLGLKALASILGIPGDPVGYSAFHLAIGREIWGDLECLREMEVSKEQVIAKLREEFTPEQWAEMDNNTKRTYKFQPGNLGLIALAGILGVDGGDPTVRRSVRLAMGREIWGDLECLREKEVSKEQVIAKLREEFTPEQWAGMDGKKKRAYKFQPGNLGLMALAGILGVDGDPVGYSAFHLAMGREIWGDRECLREKEVSKEQVIAKLREEFTPEQWAGMDGKKKRAYKFQPGNLGLMALAGILGVDGDPVGYSAFHLAMGREIWGDRECLREMEVSKEQVISRLREEFTPEHWATMARKEKAAYKFQPGNLGLIALARILGVDGNPVSNQSVHLAMGQEVWGDLECLKIDERVVVSKEQVIARLREEFTPEQWAAMGYKEKAPYKFQPGNLGLNALARILGVDGNPVSKQSFHLAMGREIWGDLECFRS